MMNRALWLILLFIWLDLGGQEIQKDEYEGSRQNMVLAQIKARGVTNYATLTAMRSVPRHLFVPKGVEQYAYNDGPLPIGYGQTISQPYIVAFMTERIRPKKDFRVLEIGTGSGYQAAVLGRIVDSVYTIEIVKELFDSASKRLKSMGYDNVVVKYADGYHGWPEKGPFDAIIVTAAAEFVPPPLIDQLKEGGRMVIPVGNPFSTQQLLEVIKEKDGVRTKNLMFVRFVPFTRSESEQ
jgi:protein-L-isoaspartate(D-aspartate) O-methyltransferase